MHHGGGFVFGKNLVQTRAVQQITLFKGAEFHGVLPAGDQVVIGHGRIARRAQCLARMRTDIARATGD